MSKLLTISIPTWNRAKILDGALYHLLHQVNEFEKLIDVVISDNYSSDNTSEIIKKWQHKYPHIKFTVYHQSRNTGFYGNFQKCKELSTGKFIWVLSDDDYVCKDVICNIISILQKYKSTLAILYLNNKVINARINNSSSYKITKIDKLFYKYNYRLTLVSTTIFLNHKENDKFIYKKFENSNFIGFALMVDVIRFRNETAILSGKLLKCRMDTISGYNFFDAFIFNIFSIFNYMVSIGYSNKIIRIFKENLIIHIWAKRYFYFKAKGKLDANLEYYDLKTANHILQKYFKGTISYWLIIFPMTLFPSSVFRKCFPYVEKLRNFMRSIN